MSIVDDFSAIRAGLEKIENKTPEPDDGVAVQQGADPTHGSNTYIPYVPPVWQTACGTLTTEFDPVAAYQKAKARLGGWTYPPLVLRRLG